MTASLKGREGLDPASAPELIPASFATILFRASSNGFLNRPACDYYNNEYINSPDNPIRG
jgi:hypothetical protein